VVQTIATLQAALATVGEPATGCQRESDRQIIATLRKVGHRCTTMRLLEEMEQGRLNPAVSTIKKRLAELVKVGRLTKAPGSKPPGYGLPEWE
jgi:hypothetical protein